MTLEDFFTSTELKDGLTNPDRVTDLITLMQKEKENVNQSTWLNVANALATTENKECLDLFVQLDGLSFIDKWLKDAQSDMENSDLEELIVGFLRALERFKVDDDVRLGIGKTVEGLFGHCSAVVREKAKALCEMWNPIPEITGMESHSGVEENVVQETDKEDVPEIVMESTIPVDENPAESESELELAGVSDSIPTDGGSGENPAETHLPGASDSVPEMPDSIPGMYDSIPGVSDSVAGMSDSIPPVTDDGGGGGGVSDSIPMAEGGEEELDVSQMLKDIEEENEKQEIASTVDSTTLIPSSTDVENDLKTEMSEKHEEMMEGGESLNPKTTSNTESDEDNEDGKKSDVNESENDNNSGSDSSSSKKSTKSQHDDLINKRPSDMELDYGIVDPLELARQVAIEIEQEVDSDSARQSSSSSSSSQSMSGIGIGIEKEPEVSSVPVETHIQTHVLESEIPIPLVEELESVQNVEKGFSGFDLNQEISSEEVGIGIGIGIGIEFPVSTPISIVSASRPEPATELPNSPLKFEGALGWKGSAATSAFRRIPEVEKTFSSSSSHRSDGLNFDLNVTESGDDKIDKTENLFSRDKMPVTYHETPRRLEKLELDLNSFSDGIGIGNSISGIGNSSSGIGIGNSSGGIGIGNSSSGIGISGSGGIGIGDSSGITLDWNRDSRISSFQNYPPTQSLPFKSIDLNLNDHSNVQNNNNNNPFLSKLFNKQQESVFSLFGTQVEVNRTNSHSNSISNSNSNSSSNPNSIPPPNGIDFTLGRPGSNSNSNSIPTPYTNIPNYPHNGFQMAPMYAPSGGTGGGYGTIPYMVPPPQMMQPVYSQPFLYAQSGSNGAGPSRNNFDLNFMGDLGNRENNGGLGLRQFFNTNQRPVDEQQYLRMNNNINISNNNSNNNNLVQGSSSSVIGGKRQEPESGWDLFPVNYKQQQQQQQHHSQHHYPHHQQPPWQ